MRDGLPLNRPYNLARLGHAGDQVTLTADTDERGAIAQWSGVLALEAFEAQVALFKSSATRFRLDFTLTARLAQACVVTLEPVGARMERRFSRELHFIGPVRRKAPGPDSGPELVLDAGEEDGPEEIESLHYDLAVPLLEEYVLALEPYPRAPGVAFDPPDALQDRPESPFAVLKGLKPGG